MRATNAKSKLLETSIRVIRTRGYADTSVDDLCAGAGVTKGAFFHHFRSKEELVLGAVDYWNSFTSVVFSEAPYASLADARARVLGYVDFRMAILDRPVGEFTCLLGTLVQETYETHPLVRKACEAGMADHIAVLVKDLAEAKQLHAPTASWTPESVGYFIQSVLQGSFIFAKAKQDAEVARENLRHLRRYLEMLLEN